MKKDISNREDIELLVKHFYAKLRNDAIIGHFFNEVMHINWEEHFPVMYNFWESVLFDKISYKGNPMLKHIALHQKSSISEQHFDQWVALWEQTIDEYFQGKKAEEAKNKAKMMKRLMLYKIQQSDTPNFIQ